MLLAIYSYGASAISAQKSKSTSFTKADIEKLRWMEGKWRGVGDDASKPFYEQYRFTHDGKIESVSYGPDTTFTQAKNNTSVFLDEGRVLHKDGDWLWMASKITDSSVEFVPKEKA